VASMVRELLPQLNDVGAEGEQAADSAPSMFKRSADVPDPLPSIRHAEPLAQLHREWIRISTPLAGQSTSPWHRLVRLGRRIASPGGVDREMIADLIRAIDAVAARCDEIADRLGHQQIVVDDMANIFGEELTRLRAESASFIGAGSESSPSASRHE
jgi:hypothetical protein